MSTPALVRTLSTRGLINVGKPKPLKSITRFTDAPSRPNIGSLEEVMQMVEIVARNMNMNNSYNDDDTLSASVMSLSLYLLKYGDQLEAIYKDQLDKAFFTFRLASLAERTSFKCRLRLLELINLRARHWLHNNNTRAYYAAKMSEVKSNQQPDQSPDPMTGVVLSPSFTHLPSPTAVVPPPVLLPGEVIKSSGKFAKPTKIAGKNYCKDEVVIRNADSGKVMGIKGRRVHMIEEFTETIISFQRVSPGVKERLVQITAQTEENVTNAVQMIEDVIRRNASPVQTGILDCERTGGSSSSLNSSASDENTRLPVLSGAQSHATSLLQSFSSSTPDEVEYKVTVEIGSDSLKLICKNLELTQKVKLFIEEKFEQNAHTIGGGDCCNAKLKEFVPITLAMPKPRRHGSLDNSSISQPATGAVATVRPASFGTNMADLSSSGSGDSEATTTCVSAENTAHIVRQPLTPASSPEDFERVEASGQMSFVMAGDRRAFFARTNSKNKADDEPVLENKLYTREFLMDCAFAVLSRVPPDNWAAICLEYPDIVKKNCKKMVEIEAVTNSKARTGSPQQE